MSSPAAAPPRRRPSTPKGAEEVDCMQRPEEKEEEEEEHEEETPWNIYTFRWDNILLVAGMHLWVLHSVTQMPSARWQTWLWLLFLWTWVGFGVLGGAHRLWSHRSYKASLPLRVLLMLGNSMAGMYCVYDWVRDHRVHHKFTDTDGDPHNSRRGLFFSHIGWIMVPPHSRVARARRRVDMRDIQADAVCAFERRFHMPLIAAMCFGVPALVPVALWGETWAAAFAGAMVRWVFQVNAILSINSFAHMFGGRPFNKSIWPTENKWVSLVSMGEGWHNYHHAFPWDYRAAEYGFLNTTMHLIRLSERLGWAWDLKTAPTSLVQRVATRYGDGTHSCAPEVPDAAAAHPALVDSLPPPPGDSGERA